MKSPGLDDLIRKVVTEGKFECRGEYDVLSEVDAVCIAVPFLFPSFYPLEILQLIG